MQILGDSVQLSRAELNEYFQFTILQEWTVGLQSDFTVGYNTRAIRITPTGTANYNITFSEQGNEDHVIVFPSKYDSELILDVSLLVLNSTRIKVNQYFKFKDTSTDDGIYSNLTSVFTVLDETKTIDMTATSTEVTDNILLFGYFKLWIEGDSLFMEDTRSGSLYRCFAYDNPSPLYTNHIKLTKGGIIKYIGMSNDSEYANYRTPLKIGGVYVLSDMKYRKPSKPTIMLSGYGKAILSSDTGTHITFDGETKPSGSEWKNLTQSTRLGNAVAFFPPSDGLERSEDSDPLYLKMLGHPSTFQKIGWSDLTIQNNNSIGALLRAFRTDDSTDWSYFTSFFPMNSQQSRTVLESFDYKDVFNTILQIGFSHRWAFTSSEPNVVNSCIIAYQGNVGFVERFTTYDDYTDYTNRPWDYQWENS